MFNQPRYIVPEDPSIQETITTPIWRVKSSAASEKMKLYRQGSANLTQKNAVIVIENKLEIKVQFRSEISLSF